MEPNPASFLDLRSLEQARQDVESARSGLKAMEAEHVKSVLQTRLARSRFKRHSELYHQSLIPEEEYEHYKSVLDQSIARENSALQAVESARHQLKKALAMTEILAGQKEHRAVPFNVRADTDGVILKRHRFQEGIIRAGDRIMETGKLEDMEVQVDLL